MRSRITRLVGISAVLVTAVFCSGAAGADPSQDDQFLDLLEQQSIPAMDGIPGLINRAHGICDELSGGTPFGNILDDQLNIIYADNPTLHLVPGRVDRTARRFINAAVGAYCPGNQGKIP